MAKYVMKLVMRFEHDEELPLCNIKGDLNEVERFFDIIERFDSPDDDDVEAEFSLEVDINTE